MTGFIVRPAWLWGTALVGVVALIIGLVALTRGGPRPFVSAAPDPVRALNEATNAQIRSTVTRQGFGLARVLILNSSIDGDRGTVTVEFDYSRKGHVTRAYATLIFHRTVWQLGQITPNAAPPGS